MTPADRATLRELAEDLESIVQTVSSRDGDATARQHARAQAVRAASAHIEALEQALDTIRASAQSWALYAFRHHGDDALLYNGLADLGGVSREGAGWKHDRLTGGGLVRHDEIAGEKND